MAQSERRRVSRRHGRQAEIAAQRFLAGHGLELLDTNYRCRFGEIDLVMHDRGQTVFVEVRYRSRSRFADARASVNSTKQARLVHTAACYLAEHPPLAEDPVRFDVVACDGLGGAGVRIEWIRDAFRP